ncbi:MAG: hypothetical protein JOS17DRAFT_779931 [Linnemannia elongata]|nr:MAG: hypothetical protein JOS17DRAFT_779931 [Linnemannia elongata]
MSNKNLTFFCLIDGGSTSFPIKIETTETIGDLKDAIKTALSPQFDVVTAKDLTLWHVSITVADDDDDDLPVLVNISIKEKMKLKATHDLSDVFKKTLPKRTTYIIVERPQPSDLHTDIKKIADKFFASGSDVAKFLDAFVKGQGASPVTSGPLEGLPTVGRRQFGKPPETLRGFVLYLDVKVDPVPAGMSRLQEVA